jgi:hypothetical protein
MILPSTYISRSLETTVPAAVLFFKIYTFQTIYSLCLHRVDGGFLPIIDQEL